jgi:hypothetical protein
MKFLAKCPVCGGQLYLHQCTLVGLEGVPILPDGFIVSDATDIPASYGEVTVCEGCHRFAPLEMED